MKASYENSRLAAKLRGNDGPIAALLRITKGQPVLANYALKRIAYKALENAREYLTGEKDPYGVAWASLWEVDGGGLYKSTPEFYREDKYVPGKDGRENHVRKYHRNSMHPLYDSGDLANSLEVLSATWAKSSGKAHIRIGSKLPYAAIHEFGGQGLNNWNLGPVPARPYLVPAILEVYEDENLKKLIKRGIQEMIRDAIKNKLPIRERAVKPPRHIS